MRLRDIMQLPEFSGFRLLAGEGGLEAEVTATEIIDFEFAEGIEFSREEMFYGRSIGLSSLMFAREAPQMLLPAVEKLYQMGVCCLAYKPIFFRVLPDEVLTFAEEHDFPVYEITDDAFFEDIVLAVKKAVGQDMTESEIQAALEKILAKDLSAADSQRLQQRIAPQLKRYIQVACFCALEPEDGSTGADAGTGVEAAALFDREHFVKYGRRLALNSRYSDRAALCRFRQGGFVLLSREEKEAGDLDVLLTDVCIAAGIPQKEIQVGMSRVLRLDSGFDTAVREAFWAMRVARIEKVPCKRFVDMGIYRLLAPEMSSRTLVSNVESFLAPLLEGEHGEEDRALLMETAVAYVRAYGNLNEAAEQLYCHKNTVRYRLRRIHEILAPTLSEEDFRECLNLAVLVLTLSRDSWEG